VYVCWRYRSRADAFEPRRVRKQIDRYQAREQHVSVLLMLVLATQVMDLTIYPPDPGAPWTAWASTAAFAFPLLVIAAHLLFGFRFIRRRFHDAIDDEFAPRDPECDSMGRLFRRIGDGRGRLRVGRDPGPSGEGCSSSGSFHHCDPALLLNCR
jgi:hypothetical protein